MRALPLVVLAALAAPIVGRAHAQAPMQREATEANPEALLEEGGARDPAKIAAAKAKAAQKPPETDDPDVLVRFFIGRAQAAGNAGLVRQQLGDMRRAGEQARHATSAIDKSAVLQRVANMEADRGYNLTAVALMTEAIALNGPPRPNRNNNRMIAQYADLANFNIRVGNVAGADAALTQVRAMRRELENSSYFRTNPNARRAIAQSVGTTGQVLHLKGQYADAEATFGEAAELYDALDTPGDRFSAHNMRAAMIWPLQMQSRLAEAENQARLVLAVSQQLTGPSSMRTSNGLLNLSIILGDQGRFAEAEGLARKAIEIRKGLGRDSAGGPRMVLAYTLAGQGKWRGVLDEIEFTQRSYRSSPDDFENFVNKKPLFGMALLRAGRVPEATERFAKLAERNRLVLGSKHRTTAESLGFLAMAHAATGQREAALAEFAEASALLLSHSRDSSDSDETNSVGIQDRNLRIILGSYIDLLADIRGTELAVKAKVDPVAESFRLADAAHSRGVLRALAASAARAAAGNPQLAESARRVQDAEKQISALNGILANAISAHAADRDENVIRDLRKRIDGLRDERGKLMGEIERKFPDYAKLVEPRPATIAEIQKTLHPGEAMVAFFSGETRTYAWAVEAQGTPAMAVAALDPAALALSVAKLRQALAPNAATIEEIPAFDVAEAHKLYQALLQPTESAWSHATNLFVVPDGALGQLPLALLVTAPTQVPATDSDGVMFSRYRSVPFLARKAGVTQLPSVASLGALRALPVSSAQRRPFVGFGDPWFNKEQAAEGQRDAAVQTASLTTRGLRLRSAPKGDANFTAEMAQLPRLADTADEVRAIAAVLHADPAQAVYIGAKASRSAIKSMDLSNARIVMFATHGLVPGDLAGLGQPALALASPDVTGNPNDGLLTVEDILALKLNADWVVLSACNTASGQGAGAEAVSGLGRAFFYAGTRALLVSNWPVETVSARSLTTDLFRRQVDNAGLSRAEALRQAELALIDGPGPAGPDGKQVFAYAHPIFWAPFSLVGDGGATVAR